MSALINGSQTAPYESPPLIFITSILAGCAVTAATELYYGSGNNTPRNVGCLMLIFVALTITQLFGFRLGLVDGTTLTSAAALGRWPSSEQVVNYGLSIVGNSLGAAVSTCIAIEPHERRRGG